VSERIMNLNLTCEFLACLCASQVGLRDYLQGPGLVLVIFILNRLDSLDFIAFGKSSFAKESSFHIFDVSWRLAFRQLTNFLLNDLQKTKIYKRV
jgi:hypothetical protein